MSNALASHWADELFGTAGWPGAPNSALRGFFRHPALPERIVAAQRYEELLGLLAMAPVNDLWHYRQFRGPGAGRTGRKSEAIRYAEAGRCV